MFGFIRIWLLAAAVFFLLDGALFRTPLYLRVLDPDSYAGRMKQLLNREKRRAVDASRDVIVLGDSRIAEGFSAKLASQTEPSLRWVNGALHAASPRVWYYLLREVDPQRNRYRAIVLPLSRLADEDPGEDPAASPLDVRLLSPVLRWTDAADFVLSYPPGERTEPLRAAILRGAMLKQDVQQLFWGPRARWREVKLWEASGAEFIDNYPGNPATLTLDENLRKRILHAPYDQSGLMTAYRQRWLGRIVDAYRGTRTRIVFVRLPDSPLPVTELPLRSTPREMAARGDAIVIDPAPFLELQRPELFFDELHMNVAGRERFTRLLAENMRSALSALP